VAGSHEIVLTDVLGCEGMKVGGENAAAIIQYLMNIHNLPVAHYLFILIVDETGHVERMSKQ